jgi:hypothetical protein
MSGGRADLLRIQVLLRVGVRIPALPTLGCHLAPQDHIAQGGDIGAARTVALADEYLVPEAIRDVLARRDLHDPHRFVLEDVLLERDQCLRREPRGDDPF